MAKVDAQIRDYMSIHQHDGDAPELKKWKQTILPLGVRVEKLKFPTDRCYVKNTTEESPINNLYYIQKNLLGIPEKY